MPTLEQVRELLMQIEVPPKGTPLLKAGWIRDLLVEDERVSFAMVVPTEYASAKEDLARQVEAILKENFPEAAVSIKALAAPPPPMLNSKTTTPGQPRKLEGVDTVIAVASGKGGVGKSTVAVHLALALRAQGLRVGLFDGDVYGPSVATMLGIRDAELRPGPQGKILPPEVQGLRVVSMAFFADENTPIIWRGAMIHKAYEQLLFDLQWAPLDVLVIDLPPGTGDPQLSLVQLA
ncbi:MAG: Mrp/NBP35 family ATP-binding protein, partial [Candidatus Hydrothermae bacterium]|nr:Mrp/NBP35 family ATP-binding protein [Candidatus Hydrothermae bacterium]